VTRSTAVGPDDRGASAVEYALILVGIAIAAIVVITAFVRVATSTYDTTCTHVGQDGIASAPPACG
jgi:Flp pilus assembly pilin Flp